MHTASHRGSIRCAGLIRRLHQERAEVAESLATLDAIEVVFPANYESEEEVSYRDVLQGADCAKGARLKVNGKVTARAKVQNLVNVVTGTVNDCREVIADVTTKLRILGVKP